MARYLNLDFLRSLPGGTGVSGATATARKRSDDSQIGSTAATDADGKFVMFDEVYPGEHYITVTKDGKSKVHDSRTQGFFGTLSGDDFPYMFRQMLSDGIWANFKNVFALSAGGGLSVNVASGGAQLYGHPFIQSFVTNKALAAAHATLPRLDRVVIRLIPPAVTDAGKISIEVLTGTPAGSPAATAVTQNLASVWEINLGTVLVPALAAAPTTITSETARAIPATHTHAIADTTGLQAALDLKANAANPVFTGTPTFPDGSIPQADVSGLVTGLAGKVNDTGDTMTGLLTLRGDLTSLLTLERAGGEDVLRVSTDLGALSSRVYLVNGTDLVIFSDDGLTTVLAIDGATGNITAAGATITPTELSYLDGASSNLQAQFAAKAPTASPSFTGTVTASGDTALGDDSADLHTVVGRFRSEKSANPTATVNTSVAGTGGTAAIAGTDHAGRITITVSTANGATTGKIADIDFAQTKPDANYAVILQARTSAASALDTRVYVTSEAAGGWDLQLQTNGGAAMATGSYIWNYWVVEYES